MTARLFREGYASAGLQKSGCSRTRPLVGNYPPGSPPNGLPRSTSPALLVASTAPGTLGRRQARRPGPSLVPNLPPHYPNAAAFFKANRSLTVKTALNSKAAIARTPEGPQASYIVTLDLGVPPHTETDVHLFDTEGSAQAWLDSAAFLRGFISFPIEIKGYAPPNHPCPSAVSVSRPPGRPAWIMSARILRR